MSAVANAQRSEWMKEYTKSESVARLSGFMYAISSISGEIRDYENFSYCIDVRDQNRSIKQMINEYFHGQHEFSFGDSEGLPITLRELEERLGAYSIRDQKCLLVDRIRNLQLHLSFRIMDMIQDIFDGSTSGLTVIEMHEEDVPPTGGVTVFCIRSISTLLVLQFNDYRSLRPPNVKSG